MKLKQTRLVAAAAIVLGMLGHAGSAYAQGAVDVDVGMAIDNSFTVTLGQDADMGEWFVVHDGVNNIELTLTTAGAVSVTNIAGTSQAVQITATEQEATVVIDAPIGPIALNMTVDNLTDFAAASNANLTDVPYDDGNGNSGTIDMTALPVGPLAVDTDAAGDMTISLGAIVNFTDTPDDATSPFTATYNVDVDF